MIKNSDRILILCGVSLLSTSANAHWLQWGGQSRDFNVAASQLASEWPAGGPKQLGKQGCSSRIRLILAQRMGGLPANGPSP